VDIPDAVDVPVEASAPTSIDTSSAEPIAAEPIAAEPIAAETASIESESPYPWDGELTSLQESDWFSTLDDRVRSSVLGGLENKHRNWSRGWTRSYQDNADARRDLDRRADAVRQSEIRVQKWLHGDVDPLNEKQSEIDDLKRVHAAAVKAIREEHELGLTKARGRTDDELEQTKKELLEHRSKLSAYAKADLDREQVQVQARERAIDAKAEQFQQWLQTNEPHVYTNDNAFEAMCTMMASGFSLKDSLTFVHGKYPKAVEPEKPAEPAPETVPESVSLMNMGSGSGTVSGETRSFEEIMDAMRRSAMQSAGGIIGH
jgi:hypothetical protein